MDYRRFGKTNLNLSLFSLGTMRCLANPQLAIATIQKAIALGINHLETARGYGKSEEYLGLALQSGLPIAREELHITTKLPPIRDRDLMTQWIDESLARLQLDYIDCLAIHGINTQEHLDAVTKGSLAAINQAQDQGKIKHLGFSTHGSLDLILAAIESDLFEFVNLHYYYFWQRNQPAIALAQKKDLGVFIISPGDKGGRLYTPPKTLQELCQPFSPIELTYRFLTSDHRITTLSVGAANPDELLFLLREDQKSNWIDPLTLEETKKLEKLQQHLEQSLNSDLCRQCYQCLPCPETINIPEILRLRNLAVAYDMNDYGQYRYRMLENAGHWFPGKKGDHCTECGDCLPRCPQNLDIPKLLKDTHNLLNGSPRRRLWE
ncbi:MAG: aldo/keto reductase [Xenococcus sp. (in: cyanobacteria)]